MSDNIPIDTLRDLVNALKTRLKGDDGTAKFFNELDEETYEKASVSDREDTNRLLLRLIEDKGRRGNVLSVLSDEDRVLITYFLNAFDLWVDLNPDDYNWVRARLSGDAYSILRGPLPTTTNAFLEIYTAITVDSRSEEYSVKSGIALGWADKAIGGDHILATASHLTPYLGSVAMMLHALRLRDSEIEVLKLPADRDIHGGIESALNDIQEELEVLKQQFKKMKR